MKSFLDRQIRAERFAENLEPLLEALSTSDLKERNASFKSYYFPNKSARYEYALIFVNAGIAVSLFLFIFSKSVLTPRTAVLSVAAIPVALFAADFLSALFHKFLDSFASEMNPLWGNAAKAFRIHHEFPINLNETTYLHNISAFAPFITILCGLSFAGMVAFDLSAPVSFGILIMLLLFANGTEIHKQAHRRDRHVAVRILQACRIFLHRKEHLNHHLRDHNESYAIVNGWSNGILNKLDVWKKADIFAWNALGIFPRNWIHDPSSIPETVLNALEAHPDRMPLEIEIYARVSERRRQAQNLRVGNEGKKPSSLMPTK